MSQLLVATSAPSSGECPPLPKFVVQFVSARNLRILNLGSKIMKDWITTFCLESPAPQSQEWTLKATCWAGDQSRGALGRDCGQTKTSHLLFSHPPASTLWTAWGAFLKRRLQDCKLRSVLACQAKVDFLAEQVLLLSCCLPPRRTCSCSMFKNWE